MSVLQVRPIRTTMPHLGVSFPESLDMALDEQQKLLNTGNWAEGSWERCEFSRIRFEGGRSQLSVTIVEVGGTPQPSPLSDRSSQQLLETPLDSGQSPQTRPQSELFGMVREERLDECWRVAWP
jgi:hypothetical protein